MYYLQVCQLIMITNSSYSHIRLSVPLSMFENCNLVLKKMSSTLWNVWYLWWCYCDWSKLIFDLKLLKMTTAYQTVCFRFTFSFILSRHKLVDLYPNTTAFTFSSLLPRPQAGWPVSKHNCFHFQFSSNSPTSWLTCIQTQLLSLSVIF